MPEYFQNFSIPISVEFIVADGDPSKGFDLTEIYDTGPGNKIQNKIGKLLETLEKDKNNLEMSLTSFFKRRKNFRGQTIKILSPHQGTAFPSFP